VNKLITVFLSVLSFSPICAQEKSYKNSIGMEFVLIKPGKFILGRFQPPFPKPVATSDSDRQHHQGVAYSDREYELAGKLARSDARPGFTVEIQNAFYIGKFEVTQAQWKKVMGANPSVFQGHKIRDDADLHPVDNVTWQDAQLFLTKLNAIDNAGRYRLPTEFEWEYAARSGAEDDIPWADIRRLAQLGTRTTNRIGQKEPNAWELYDMLGNVWEWTQEYYNEKIFADPKPPISGKTHVLKGASFVGDVKNATYMTHAGGPGNGWDVGFRVVREVGSGESAVRSWQSAVGSRESGVVSRQSQVKVKTEK